MNKNDKLPERTIDEEIAVIMKKVKTAKVKLEKVYKENKKEHLHAETRAKK